MTANPHPTHFLSRPQDVLLNGRKVRIVCVGENRRLLEMRELVLRHSGYEAHTAYGLEGLQKVDLGTFDLAILCHSVPTQDIAGIVRKLRSGKTVLPIIWLAQHNEERIRSQDEVVESLDGPAALIRTVAAIVEKLRKRA